MIVYQSENVSVDAFIEILKKSTLGERRPIEDRERMEKMVRNANVIITARDAGMLVGIARAFSDFSFITYLSDLAVSESHQSQGIGKELIKKVKMATPDAKLILLSAPKAVDYYPKIGMKRHEHCFILDNLNELR